MKFEVEININAVKHMVLEADNADDAVTKAETICETVTIPITPEDMADIYVEDVFLADEEQEFIQ